MIFIFYFDGWVNLRVWVGCDVNTRRWKEMKIIENFLAFLESNVMWCVRTLRTVLSFFGWVERKSGWTCEWSVEWDGSRLLFFFQLSNRQLRLHTKTLFRIKTILAFSPMIRQRWKTLNSRRTFSLSTHTDGLDDYGNEPKYVYNELDGEDGEF